MASPNYINANVVPSSDTFREWVDLTNRITYDMEKIVITTVANSQGACTTGNAYVNGIFSSNTLLVSTAIKGTSPNTTVFGTEAITANLTIATNTVQQGILFGQANIVHTGGLFVTSANVNINSTSTTFTSNAATNIFNTKIDANANVDIDNALTTITSTNTVIENGELNITSNVNADAASFDIASGLFNVSSNVTINSTATTFTSNAGTNIFNTPLDVNANVDIDAGSVDIAGGELTTSSNVTINSTSTAFTSNAVTNIFNTEIDANANLDVDNALSDFNSNTFNVLGTTANLNSTTVSVTGTSFVSSANVNITAVNTQIGDANTDVLNVAANTVFADKVNVQKAADFDSTVNIDGAATLNSTLDVDGVTTINDTTVANSTVGSIQTDGGLSVAKNAYIVGNTDIDGTITVDELATFNGDVDFGSNTSDTVSFTSRVDSGINPNANGTLSLGTTALRWNAFGSTITTTDLYAQSNTYANGNIFLGKGVGATYRISHIAQSGSNTAANNDFYITTIGQVSTANVTHDADRLIVKAQVGNSTVGVMPLAGNTVPLGNGTHRWVMSANTLNASGDITAGSDVDITNEANTNTLRVRSTSALSGLATLSQGITVSGTSNVATFNATGLASLDGGIDVSNSVFTVANTSGNISTTGTLNVGGATSLSNTLSVAGKATFDDLTAANSSAASVHTDGGLTVAKNAYIVGNTDIDGTLSVDGAATLNGAVDLGDASADTIRILGSIGGNSTVGIIPSASGRILGTSDKRFAAQLTTVNASGDITAGSDVDITSEANTSTLRVRSTSSFEGAIGFGNSTINANLTANTTQSLFEVDKVVVTDFTASGEVSLPSNTVLNLATANTADLSVTNSAAFSAGANVVVTFGNGNGRATIQFANAVVNTNIISDATTRDIGSSSARWGSGYFNTEVSVGANTIANTTTLIADDIFARNDLIGNYSSDQALKDNLVVLPQALNKIEQLNGYQFKWNDNIGDERRLTMDYGVVAQELESVLPHAVSINSRGYKSVRYNAILPLLIEAVKELSQRVKELEENNDG